MGVARTRTTAQATAEGLRVFVAGVPWHITEEVLRRDFEECGVVEDLFLLRDQEGNSRGRCFITFRESDAVQAALKYDNTDYGGRIIYVKIAEEKRGISSGGQIAPAEKPQSCESLCLKKIGSATDADVRKLLDGCAIKSVRVLSDRETGAPRGVALVDFESTEDVDKAMKFNGKKVKGSEVQMSYVEQKSAAQASKREKPAKFPEAKPAGCTSLCFKNLGDATEDDIWQFLDGLDVQAVRLCYDRVSGLSRGIAFVDFPATKEVDRAMDRNGKEVKGSAVQMHYEAPRERPYPEGCMTVAVKKLPSTTLEYDVRKLFKGLKSIVDVRVICDKSEACTGLGFAEFSDVADVKAAVQRDGMSVHGQVVFICYETKPKKTRDWESEYDAAAEGGAEVQKSNKRKLKDAANGEQGDGDPQITGICEKTENRKRKRANREAAQKEACKASSSQVEEPTLEEREADESLAKSNKDRKKERRKTLKAEKQQGASLQGGMLEVNPPEEDVTLDVAGSAEVTKPRKAKKRKLIKQIE